MCSLITKIKNAEFSQVLEPLELRRLSEISLRNMKTSPEKKPSKIDAHRIYTRDSSQC
jgi:hypothetical protein